MIAPSRASQIPVVEADGGWLCCIVRSDLADPAPQIGADRAAVAEDDR